MRKINIVCLTCKSTLVKASEILNSQVAGNDKTGVSGVMTCEKCGEKYYIKSDIPFVFRWDNFSIPLLKEIAQYRDFYYRIKSRRIESDRLQFKKEEITTNLKLYRSAFEEAVKKIDFSKNPLILDIGSGMCETSYNLALAGGDVVSTEISTFDFFNPRIFSIHDKECSSFYESFDGVEKITPEKINFRRILCSAENLPFEDNVFDIIFIRSVLHHALSLKKMLNEASRVLKKGGKIVIVSEPNKPAWEPEEKFLEPVLDYQEGIRERYLKFSDYKNNLIQNGFSYPAVQVVSYFYGDYARKLFRLFGKKPDPLFFAKRYLTSLQIKTRLPLMNASINIYAEKKSDVPAVTRIEPSEIDPGIMPDPAPDVSKEKSGGISLSEFVAEFDSKLSLIRKLIRENIEISTIPDVIYFADKTLPPGTKCWREPEDIAGTKARHAFRDSFALLYNKNKREKICIEYYFPEHTINKEDEYSVDVYINDTLTTKIVPQKSGWQKADCSISGMSNSPYLEIRFTQNKMVLNKDKKEVGIAVSKIVLQ